MEKLTSEAPVWSVAGFVRGHPSRSNVFSLTPLWDIYWELALLWTGQRPSQCFTDHISPLMQTQHNTHTHAWSETSKLMHSPYSFYTTFLFCTYNFKLRNRPLSLEWDLMGWFRPFYLLKQIKPCGVRACDIKHSGSCCGYIDKCKRFSFLSLVHTPGAA